MRLFHRDLGGAGLPPLVLLHGMLGSSRNWQAAGRDLATAFHAFALDLRNHGSSPHTDTMTYAEMAGDVLGWLEGQGIGPALFLAGAKSTYIEAGDHAAIRAHFPAARIHVLPNAGHNPHMEAREAFVAAVLG